MRAGSQSVAEPAHGLRETQARQGEQELRPRLWLISTPAPCLSPPKACANPCSPQWQVKIVCQSRCISLQAMGMLLGDSVPKGPGLVARSREPSNLQNSSVPGPAPAVDTITPWGKVCECPTSMGQGEDGTRAPKNPPPRAGVGISSKFKFIQC